MKIKPALIGFDLDGTLLTSDKRLTEHTREILRKAHDMDIILVPSTGRPSSGIPADVLELPGVRYVISSNGGRILDLKEDRALYEKLVPADTARHILDIFGHYDSLREIYYDGVGYAQEDKLKRVASFLESPPMAEYVRSTRRPVPDLMEKFNQENRSVDKVQGLFLTLADRDAALEELKSIPDISVTGALEKNIEVNAGNVNKGRALEILGRMLGISISDILAFGDASNDVSMIREAGTGVAMGNGTPEVIEAADFVTASNDEDGVAGFIETYVLD